MASPKELVGASTSLLILGVLAKAPSYGYQIVRSINDAADGVFQWQEGTIYPVLHKLEKERLVRAQWQESDTGRQRKYYYITAKGRASLSADAKQWNSFHNLVLRMLSSKSVS
jgi:DNA-binding PadR family transcriptional regulator